MTLASPISFSNPSQILYHYRTTYEWLQVMDSGPMFWQICHRSQSTPGEGEFRMVAGPWLGASSHIPHTPVVPVQFLFWRGSYVSVAPWWFYPKKVGLYFEVWRGREEVGSQKVIIRIANISVRLVPYPRHGFATKLTLQHGYGPDCLIVEFERDTLSKCIGTQYTEKRIQVASLASWMVIVVVCTALLDWKNSGI